MPQAYSGPTPLNDPADPAKSSGGGSPTEGAEGTGLHLRGPQGLTPDPGGNCGGKGQGSLLCTRHVAVTAQEPLLVSFLPRWGRGYIYLKKPSPNRSLKVIFFKLAFYKQPSP